MFDHIKIVECPRDAMQGLHEFIPTEIKAAYINQLLKVGYDTLDFGSFVSPKAIPQMRDTKEVLELLDLQNTSTKLLAIVANTRGAVEASAYAQIQYLGFPFSISETFQNRNTNSSIEESLETVKEMLSICKDSNKKLVVYLSMGFGNPYGDEWNIEIVSNWAKKLVDLGVEILSIADTTGVSTPASIKAVFVELTSQFPSIEWGVHLHSTPFESVQKVEAAYDAGCRRFDSALLGFGGCPMATDDLTGNIATEALLVALDSRNVEVDINREEFEKAKIKASAIFL